LQDVLDVFLRELLSDWQRKVYQRSYLSPSKFMCNLHTQTLQGVLGVFLREPLSDWQREARLLLGGDPDAEEEYISLKVKMMMTWELLSTTILDGYEYVCGPSCRLACRTQVQLCI